MFTAEIQEIIHLSFIVCISKQCVSFQQDRAAIVNLNSDIAAPGSAVSVGREDRVTTTCNLQKRELLLRNIHLAISITN